MTPEEYERLKEAEKEHLRKMRKLKQAVRDLERQKKVSDAVERITDDPRRLLDEQEDLVDQIAMEAARSEARLEIAMEAAEAEAPEAEAPEATPRISDEEADRVLRRERARQLVRQMKQTDSPMSESSSEAVGAKSASAKDEADSKFEDGEEAAPPELPEKTIGRMKP